MSFPSDELSRESRRRAIRTADRPAKSVIHILGVYGIVFCGFAVLGILLRGEHVSVRVAFTDMLLGPVRLGWWGAVVGSVVLVAGGLYWRRSGAATSAGCAGIAWWALAGLMVGGLRVT
jgi:hypothetical protein